MSGVWYEEHWYPRTGYQCRRCGKPVFESDLKESGYEYQCFHCDEDMFNFEVDIETVFPRIAAARPVDGIPPHAALEYLLDDSGEIRIFKNQLEAEDYLLNQAVPYDSFANLHFIIYDGIPRKGRDDMIRRWEQLTWKRVEAVEVFVQEKTRKGLSFGGVSSTVQSLQRRRAWI